MYKPLDVKAPSDFRQDAFPGPKFLYYNTFGKMEYEGIVQRILERSQQNGRWESLTLTDFAGLFEDLDRQNCLGYFLEYMVLNTKILERNGEEYKLSDMAINVLVEKYPSRRSR